MKDEGERIDRSDSGATPSTPSGEAVLAIIKTTIRYLRHSPHLWLLGFVTALASDGLGILIGRLVGSQLPDRSEIIGQPELIAELLFTWGDQLNENLIWVVSLLLLSMVVLGYLWTLIVNAQAAQIELVDALERGRTIGLRSAWRSGRPFVGRLIGVDTLAFLPLFLLLLLILILLSLFLISLILTLDASIDLGENGMTVIGIVGLCIVPLLFLILPTLLATLLFRLVGARIAVLDDLPARNALRQVRPWLRQHVGLHLVLGLFSLASWYLLGLVARFVSIGFGVLKTALPLLPIVILGDIGQIGFQLGIGTARLTLISILWTLAYLHLKKDESSRS